MIDIHNHILPGIDDGANKMIDSLQMAQAAVNQGIQTIIATPHHQNGKYYNPKKDIELYVSELKEILCEANIPLTVLTGQETRINSEMINELKSGIIATLNNTQYVFVEFPSAEIPRFTEQLLFELQVNGYTPIIVHPERNLQIAENPSILFEYVHKGALSQITAASLIGKFGKPIQRLTHLIIDHNLAHFLASDAHNTTSRGFVMQEAFKTLKNNHGIEMFNMFMENPQLLIENKFVYRNEPKQIVRRKKIFGLI